MLCPSSNYSSSRCQEVQHLRTIPAYYKNYSSPRCQEIQYLRSITLNLKKKNPWNLFAHIWSFVLNSIHWSMLNYLDNICNLGNEKMNCTTCTYLLVHLIKDEFFAMYKNTKWIERACACACRKEQCFWVFLNPCKRAKYKVQGVRKQLLHP